MRNQQAGFTLIELVMVIVILGILAATALPKFIDTTAEARTAAVKGVAGGLASASAINYAAALAKGAVTGGTTAVGAPIIDTTGGCVPATGTALVDGVSFAASGAGTYNVTGTSTAAAHGDKTTCTVTNNDDTTKTSTFVLIWTK